MARPRKDRPVDLLEEAEWLEQYIKIGCLPHSIPDIQWVPGVLADLDGLLPFTLHAILKPLPPCPNPDEHPYPHQIGVWTFPGFGPEIGDASEDYMDLFGVLPSAMPNPGAWHQGVVFDHRGVVWSYFIPLAITPFERKKPLPKNGMVLQLRLSPTRKPLPVWFGPRRLMPQGFRLPHPTEEHLAAQPSKRVPPVVIKWLYPCLPTDPLETFAKEPAKAAKLPPELAMNPYTDPQRNAQFQREHYYDEEMHTLQNWWEQAKVDRMPTPHSLPPQPPDVTWANIHDHVKELPREEHPGLRELMVVPLDEIASGFAGYPHKFGIVTNTGHLVAILAWVRNGYIEQDWVCYGQDGGIWEARYRPETTRGHKIRLRRYGRPGDTLRKPLWFLKSDPPSKLRFRSGTQILNRYLDGKEPVLSTFPALLERPGTWIVNPAAGMETTPVRRLGQAEEKSEKSGK